MMSECATISFGPAFLSVIALTCGKCDVLQRMQEGHVRQFSLFVPNLHMVPLIWHCVSRDGSRIQRLLSWQWPC